MGRSTDNSRDRVCVAAGEGATVMKTISTVFPSPGLMGSVAHRLYEDAIGFVAALALVGVLVYVTMKSWIEERTDA